jgi:DNA-binding CsgD family transcriptional regulator
MTGILAEFKLAPHCSQRSLRIGVCVLRGFHITAKTDANSFLTFIVFLLEVFLILRCRECRARPEFPFELSSGDGYDLPHFEIKDSSPNPEQICHEREQLLRILRSIDNLQPKMHETMQLSMDKECSMKEIARTLGISVASAKSRLYRARRHIASKKDLLHVIGRRKSSTGTQLKAARIDGSCS